MANKKIKTLTTPDKTKYEFDASYVQGKVLFDGDKIKAAHLPSYVDDVLEGQYKSATLFVQEDGATAYVGEKGKIYVDILTNPDDPDTYRWSGSAYIKVGDKVSEADCALEVRQTAAAATHAYSILSTDATANGNNDVKYLADLKVTVTKPSSTETVITFE